MTGARKVQVSPQDKQHVRLIKAIRQERHWSQQRLAQELGVARSTVAAWETGSREPHPAWLKLIRALDPAA